jgi:hypothetical protein
MNTSCVGCVKGEDFGLTSWQAGRMHEERKDSIL